jgi:hypothetical protein
MSVNCHLPHFYGVYILTFCIGLLIIAIGRMLHNIDSIFLYIIGTITCMISISEFCDRMRCDDVDDEMEP